MADRPPFRSPFAPRPLWASDLPRLRLDAHPRLSHAEAAMVLNESPGASFWIPAVDEFVIVAPWRHRAELSTVHTFGAFAHEDALLRAAIDHAEASGRAGFVVVDINEIRGDAFYREHDLVPFERVATYAMRDAKQFPRFAGRRDLSFRKVEAGDVSMLQQLIELDHAAFPWLWWNSEEEFAAYIAYPGVDIWAMLVGEVMVAYAGITNYRRWGHLDRIAVHPSIQGQGLGLEMLNHAMRQMLASGARSVALSTQEDNHGSRRLYERTGFVRTPKDDYGLYLRSFDYGLMNLGMDRQSRAGELVRTLSDDASVAG